MKIPWDKSVVHLEGASDSEQFKDYVKRIDDLRLQLEKGAISMETFTAETGKNFRDRRFRGTAIFYKNRTGKFLITARHVVVEKLGFGGKPVQGSWFSKSRKVHSDTDFEFKDDDEAFDIIFRVPTLDEAVAGNLHKERQFLMNARSWSIPELDISLISLNERLGWFAQELEELGYIALEEEHFDDEPSEAGEEVFTIGFPSATALVGQVRHKKSKQDWASSFISLPTRSFGHISMLHPALSYFWCDLSIYPGNSGGPVIEKNKIVGIITDQAAIPLDGSSEGYMSRIPFGRAIKAKYIKRLIEYQMSMD